MSQLLWGSFVVADTDNGDLWSIIDYDPGELDMTEVVFSNSRGSVLKQLGRNNNPENQNRVLYGSSNVLGSNLISIKYFDTMQDYEDYKDALSVLKSDPDTYLQDMTDNLYGFSLTDCQIELIMPAPKNSCLSKYQVEFSVIFRKNDYSN